MKLDQLAYFLAAAKQQHIGKAAHVVSISPSAISHAVSALERELGRELFVKKGKNIFLTAHGRLLMEKAEDLLARADRVKEELSSETVELKGHYRLAATHLLSSRLLAPAWTSVQNVNPSLSAEIYTLRSAQVIASLTSGEMDFGVTFSPQDHPRLELRTLHKGNLVFVVRKGHPVLKLNREKRAKALSSYPACLAKAFQGVADCESHPEFPRHGIIPDPKLLFDSNDVAAAHIRDSNSWGLFTDWSAHCYAEGLAAFAPTDWRAPYTVSAVWPKHRQLPRALKKLIVELEASLRDQLRSSR